MSDTTLVSIQDVAKRLDVSVRSVWRLTGGNPDFPKPIKIGRSTRFVLAEVDSYVESLMAERRIK